MKQNARHLSVLSLKKIALTAALSDGSPLPFAWAQGDPYVCVCIDTHTHIYICTMHMKCIRVRLYEHTNFAAGVCSNLCNNRQKHLDDLMATESCKTAQPLS